MAHQKLSLEQQVALCQQIALLTRAKLPLESQLANIAGQQSGSLAESARHVEQQLVQGKSLVDSLASESSVNSRTLAACIEAGQASNQLDSTLERWTSMHLANAQSSKRLVFAMIYPLVLIVIMLISIGMTSWNLIPEIRDTYALFQQELPKWLDLLVKLRENFVWLLLAMFVATFLPLSIWRWRRRGMNQQGLPKLLEKRLRLEALATRLASIQLASSRPLSEIAPRCLLAMGVEKQQSEQSFANLQARRPLNPLPPETSMLLGSLHGGIIDRDRAVEMLNVVGDQLDYQAEMAASRDSRWLPMFVALIVLVVTLSAYGLLVYLPWIQLMYKIGQP
jgi:Type II secretion system (T2SS), protein F